MNSAVGFHCKKKMPSFFSPYSNYNCWVLDLWSQMYSIGDKEKSESWKERKAKVRERDGLILGTSHFR